MSLLKHTSSRGSIQATAVSGGAISYKTTSVPVIIVHKAGALLVYRL